MLNWQKFWVRQSFDIFSTSFRPIPNVMGILYLWMNFDIFLQNVLNLTSTFSNFLIKVQIKLFFTNKKEQSSRKFQTLLNMTVCYFIFLFIFGEHCWTNNLSLTLKWSARGWVIFVFVCDIRLIVDWTRVPP